MRESPIQPEQACDGGLPWEEVCPHEPKVRVRVSVRSHWEEEVEERRQGSVRRHARKSQGKA